MPRILRSAAVAVLATATLGVPGVAMADDTTFSGPVTINCDHCQIAGGDIFNAGWDNNDDTGGSGEVTGAGAPKPLAVNIFVVSASRYSLALTAQTGVGDYPPAIFSRSGSHFEASVPSEARYVNGVGSVTIVVNEAGSVQCSADDRNYCQVEAGPGGFTVFIF